MKKQIHVACSPLTGTIFAGHVLKSGTWSANKQDVTLEALVAVAKHAEKFGRPVEIRRSNGELEYRITVEKEYARVLPVEIDADGVVTRIMQEF
jgi:hypothetical protein